MNYLVVRDDFGGFRQRTPNFNCWWFADDVDLSVYDKTEEEEDDG